MSILMKKKEKTPGDFIAPELTFKQRVTSEHPALVSVKVTCEWWDVLTFNSRLVFTPTVSLLPSSYSSLLHPSPNPPNGLLSSGCRLISQNDSIIGFIAALDSSGEQRNILVNRNFRPKEILLLLRSQIKGRESL